MNRSAATLLAWAAPVAVAAILAGCGPKPAKSDAAPAATPAAAPAAAPADADPATSAKVWVTKLYSRYDGGSDFNPIVTRDGVWDPAMLALMAKVDKAQDAGDGALFDFEPLCACQDNGGMTWQVTDASSSAPDKAEVTVTRVIGTDTGEVKLSLVRVGGDWRIHDVGTRDVESYSALLTEALSDGD